MSHPSKDLFDDITLAEERNANEGYSDGFEQGQAQGNEEAYLLGYAKGLQVGEELGKILGQVVARQQLPHTGRVQRSLEQLRALLDQVPRTNDPEVDILGALEAVRIAHRRLRAQLGGNAGGGASPEEDRKDYSF
ncbi:hypothetical protein KR018_004252 [Drosophila ironensis]|nr:hypothetical protein KR018_004252 [Drosophila ironensis]